ncbi:hypothetical protein OG741_00620 [Streptomyces sp. NBC_01410]|uniref:hypothetical protein n=1 Tax=Streptomyces sp. NBC_01410 TaxID=2903856 RepID=UPI00324FBC14
MVVSVADSTPTYDPLGNNGARFRGNQTGSGTSTVDDLVIDLVSIHGGRAFIRVSGMVPPQGIR